MSKEPIERDAASRNDDPEAWVSGGHERFETPTRIVSAADRVELGRLEYDAIERRLDAYHGAMVKISEQQPEVLQIIERNGFVFDSIGREPGNWQHLAFTLYSHICEIDSIARAVLGDEE